MYTIMLASYTNVIRHIDDEAIGGMVPATAANKGKGSTHEAKKYPNKTP